MKNIVDEYVNFTEKNIKQYMKMIFANKYNAKLVDAYLKTYINVRFYNICDVQKKSRPFYLKIMDELDKKYENLLKEYNKEAAENIFNVRQAFYYILFWDNVRDVDSLKSIKDIKETVDKIAILREEKFGIKKDDDFKKNLYNQIKDDMTKKGDILDKFESNDFSLNLQKNKKPDNVYYSKLEYNIRLPMIYSQKAIERVYDEGIIAENKLKVEYIMLSMIIMKDIVNGNFEDIYIAEFTPVLLKKQKKMNSILEIINNSMIQDKICLNISYKDFIENRNTVLEYIRKGFKFSIMLDDNFKEISELDKLKMFNFIIFNKKNGLYKEIAKCKTKYDNIIEQ